MTDRVPLEQSTEETPPIEQGPMAGTGKGDSPDEFYAKKEMSVMLGFEDGYFEGMGREADAVYKWAMDNSSDPLDAIHSLVRGLGIQSRGKDLLRRLNQWVTFDTKQRELQKGKDRIVGSRIV